MASWRAAGGEPDVAPLVLEELRRCGFRLVSTRPLVFAARPGEALWQWPASFIETNTERLLALRRVTPSWVTDVQAALSTAERDPESLMITPTVLEIIAERA